VQSAVGVVFNKRFYLQVALLPKYRTGAVKHSTAGLHQRPKRIEQVFLNGGKLGNVARRNQRTSG
jgi:hypothetical protein